MPQSKAKVTSYRISGAIVRQGATKCVFWANFQMSWKSIEIDTKLVRALVWDFMFQTDLISLPEGNVTWCLNSPRLPRYVFLQGYDFTWFYNHLANLGPEHLLSFRWKCYYTPVWLLLTLHTAVCLGLYFFHDPYRPEKILESGWFKGFIQWKLPSLKGKNGRRGVKRWRKLLKVRYWKLWKSSYI